MLHDHRRELTPGLAAGAFNPVLEVQAHIRASLQRTNRVLAPAGIARNLRALNRHFRLGRQEDAHEFLRCLLDGMQEACLKHVKPKPTPTSETAESTFVHRIFGGRLRSQVKCSECK